MKNYKIWRPDYEDESDAAEMKFSEIDSFDVEKYARKKGIFDSQERAMESGVLVHVRDEDGLLSKFRVFGELYISYRAIEEDGL